MDFSIEALDNYLNLVDDAIKPGEINVLLVDHNKESLNFTAQMLESCLYKVSKVESSSSALSRISTGEHFDIVMIDIHSPGGFDLLDKFVSMQLIVILMSDKEEPRLAKMALERGAFLLINKPVSMEMAKLLWQHVLRERLKNPVKQQVDHQVPNQSKESNQKMENRGKRKGRSESSHEDRSSHKKKLIEWDNDLHDKFMDAVNQLGEGKCYPKYILQRMSVPGLTRLQVASHLQKCRNNNWRAPDKNKIFLPTCPKVKPSSKKRDNSARYGTMPTLHMNVAPQNNDTSQSFETFANDQEGERSNQECQPSSHDSLQLLNMPVGRDFSLENAMDLVYESFCTSSEASREGGSGSNNALFTPNSGTSVNQLYEENASGHPYISTITNDGEIPSSQEQILDDFFVLPGMEKILSDNMGMHQGSGSSDGADKGYHEEEKPSVSVDIEQALWDPITEVPVTINNEIGSLEFGFGADDFDGTQNPHLY